MAVELNTKLDARTPTGPIEQRWDKRKFELAEARNQADQMCYQLEKLMRENADKLGEKDKAPLEKAVQKTRDVAKGNDTQAIRSAISELEQASQAFSKTLYERAQAGAQPDQAGAVEADGAAIGSGDFSAQIEVPAGLEGSVMGQLRQTQQQLRELDLERQLSQQELVKSQELLLQSQHLASLGYFINPLVNWLWLGAFVFILGTLVAAWPDKDPEVVVSRSRVARVVPAAKATGD